MARYPNRDKVFLQPFVDGNDMVSQSVCPFLVSSCEIPEKRVLVSKPGNHVICVVGMHGQDRWDSVLHSAAGVPDTPHVMQVDEIIFLLLKSGPKHQGEEKFRCSRDICKA